MTYLLGIAIIGFVAFVIFGSIGWLLLSLTALL